ncbi:MAG TPA: DUF4382 domain-containing protein [Caldimonas sp.]|nr:DUF4382 domain-containing protein [Caldimonas sp.]
MTLRPHQPAQPRARVLAVQLACACALLGGCGGGSDPAGLGAGSSQSQIQSVPMQTYITDNLATDYSKVWVSIEKITAVDSSGAEVTLLDATATPAVVNLASLAAVGQFMSTAGIPAGVYTEVRVTLANSVQLVSLDGSSTITAKLAASGTEVVVHVRNLSLDTATSGQLVLDFNLAKFTYDPSTGLVTPVVEAPLPSDAFGKFVRQQAEVNGLVQSVDTTAQSLTVNDRRLGNGVVVTLGADAVVVDEASGMNITLAGIAAGAHVEIRGIVTPGATTADPVTVVASVIHVEAAQPPLAAPTVSGDGKVTAVNGNLVTVTVDEASFLPGANSVVVDITTAKFAHGQASDLAGGVTVAFRGTVSGSGASTTVLASDIDVQGAPSQGDRQKNPEQKFTAVNGAIASLNSDGTFTVNVTQADGPFVVPGPYSVDATNATYLEGNASCLATGVVVQAVGSLVSTTLTAKFMKVKGCVGETHSEPPLPAPAPAASSPEPSASGPK